MKIRRWTLQVNSLNPVERNSIQNYKQPSPQNFVLNLFFTRSSHCVTDSTHGSGSPRCTTSCALADDCWPELPGI